ncbi:MAG: 3-dehydroquinate synthase family protein, partial [Candidatus Bathyarchaeia archaeon]
MRSVRVETKQESYQILIERGLLARTGSEVQQITPPHCRKTVIVSNRRVYKEYGEVVESSLKQAGYDTAVFLMGDGERYKTLSTASRILTHLLEQRAGRHDLIVALGGGVVGDVAGFVAATFMRGIDLVQIPTTLLAQIDSSVGGKTGVNHRLGKNLIGAFKQPRLVLIDPDTLATLPRRELMAAMQEAVKYGAIADSELFAMLEQGNVAMEELILRCCQIKAR